MDLLKKKLAAFQRTQEQTFWQEMLAAPLPRSTFLYDEVTAEAARPLIETIVLDPSLAARLLKISNDSEANLHAISLSAVFALLYKHTHQADLIIGTPVYEADIMAESVTTLLPIRMSLRQNDSFRQILLQTKEALKDAIANRHYPIELLADSTSSDHTHPFCAVLLLVEGLQSETAISSVTPDLLFSFQVQGGTIHITAKFNQLHYNPTTVQRLLRRLVQLLRECLFGVDKPLAHISVLDEAERNLVLHAFNQTTTPFPHDMTLHQLFEAQVARTPQAAAIVAWDARLTYDALNKAANKVAHYLRSVGIGPETLVGLMVEQSSHIAIGILGILKAGAAYLPIDPVYPEARKQLLIQESQLHFLLTEQSIWQKNQGLIQTGLHTILLEDLWLAAGDEHNPTHLNQANDLVYVIHTSGTTGIPHAVMVEHQGLVNYIHWRIWHYALTEQDNTIQSLSFAFDAFGTNFYSTLLSGGKFVIPDTDTFNNAEALWELIIGEGINNLSLGPAFYHLLLETCPPGALRRIRFAALGGEKTTPAIFNKSRTLAPDLHMVNEYGPTENTITTTANRDMDVTTLSVIGRPIANKAIYILDEADQLQPIGVPGEICVGGIGLARGYLYNPRLTSTKFTPHPFIAGERIYRTGDQGVWRPDGTLEFLGRLDNQVKIRGYRISLEEIEKAVAAFPGIDHVVAVVLDNQALAAYFSSREENISDRLRGFLQSRLPAFMVPTYLVQLATMPITPNNKPDREALPDPRSLVTGHGATDYENETQKIMHDVWQTVLGTHEFGLDDNFFHLGGDSIKAILLSSKLKSHDIHIGVKDIYEYPTVASLSQQTGQKKLAIDQSPVEGVIPLTPIQKWFFEKGFHEAGHFNQAVMIFRAQKMDPVLVRAAMELLMFHHDVLRATFEESSSGYQQINRAYEEGLFSLLVVACDDITQAEIDATQAAVNLQDGSLVHLKQFVTPDGDYLLIVVHHLLVDGVSWRILVEDFVTVYKQLEEGDTLHLPHKTHAFQTWAAMLNQYAASETVKEEAAYWQAVEAQLIPALLPDNVLDPSDRTYQRVTDVSFQLSEALTEALLQKIHFAYNSEINDVLLAALALALREWQGLYLSKVYLEGHGREDVLDQITIERTVGWFTSQYPVVIRLENEDIATAIKTTKETLRQVPHKGIGYGVLKYLSPFAAAVPFQAEPEISFNYLGHVSEGALHGFSLSQKELGHNISRQAPFPHKLIINGIILDGRLEMIITFHEQEFRLANMKALAAAYQHSLEAIIEHCLNQTQTVKTASDFTSSDLDEEELADIMGQL